MSDEPGISGPKRWRTSDFTRAVIELAQALGWDVASLTDVTGRQSSASEHLARSMSASSLLVLASVGRRRLLLAELRSDGSAEVSRRGSAFVASLRELARDAAADGRDRAVADAGQAVPSMDLVVWGPRDLADGSIHRALR